MRGRFAVALCFVTLLSGCYQDSPSPVAVYNRPDGHQLPPQQADADLAACHVEGEDAAQATIARQGGGAVSALAADANKGSAERDCMTRHGYDSKPPPPKGIFN